MYNFSSLKGWAIFYFIFKLIVHSQGVFHFKKILNFMFFCFFFPPVIPGYHGGEKINK
jgi:hypothetical protein